MRVLINCVSVAMALGIAVPLAASAPPPTAASMVSDEEVYEIAREAFLYLHPLVLMDLTRRVQTTAAPKGNPGGAVPVNTFKHLQAFPNGDFREIVRPNFDTLYSTAWLDLSQGPVMLTVPPGIDRYFLLPMMDMWTNVFAVPGTRTLGAQGGEFAVVPPGWKGRLPAGVERIDAPTSVVWLIGRTQTNGVADYAHVRAIQQGYRLRPLRPSGPAMLSIDTALDRTTPPARQMVAMRGIEFFRYALALLSRYPARIDDQPVTARMARIGLRAGSDLSDLSPAKSDALDRAARDGFAALADNMQKLPTLNTWRFGSAHQGSYGGDYRYRAYIAQYGLGAVRPEDAIYPSAFTDSDGKPLDGANRYAIHFDKEQLPPARAFWSITGYDREGFTTPNVLKRYAIGDRDALKFNADGSLDLWIQAPDPGGDKTANWLPVPAQGRFNLTMRLYSPKTDAIEARWAPPAVTRVL